MKISTDENKSAAIKESANLIVDTIPRVMALMRADLRKAAPDKLTVPQFRSLAYLFHNPEASVCSVAEYLDLSVSNVSKMLYALMERGYISYTTAPEDRRRVELQLTEQGVDILNTIRQVAIDHASLLLSESSIIELSEISAAMRSLQKILPVITPHGTCQKQPCLSSIPGEENPND
ncbi:MAG: MarR family transcriptional regulator [bacterium]